MNRDSLVIAAVCLFSLRLFSQSYHPDLIQQDSWISYHVEHPLHGADATSKSFTIALDVDTGARVIRHVSVEVDVTSFDSRNSNRDSHAMEVVDALSYPTSSFTSTKIEQKGDSLYTTGNLSFHGVTNEVEIRGVTNWSDQLLVIRGKFDISLTAFMVERPSLMMIPVKDDLAFEMRAVFKLK